MRQSRYRIYNTADGVDKKRTEGEEKKCKTNQLEGLSNAVKRSMILGYGSGGEAPRQMMASKGVSDNFSHVQLQFTAPKWEKPHNKNVSQIVFG